MSKDFEYDSIVIGGGAAGLTASGISANFGARTMMIEADKLGGDCTWTGCVPSKTLLHVANVAREMDWATESGFIESAPDLDFSRVMEHVRTLRGEVYEEADKPELFEEQNVDVIHGTARFTDAYSIDIDLGESINRRVTSKYFFICTGSKPFIPAIEGIDEVDYLTSKSLFEIGTQPGHLIIIGAGPIGIEMAQAFRRLGSNVTVIDMANRMLSNDDKEPVGILKNILENEGISFHMGVQVENITQDSKGIHIKISEPEGPEMVTGSDLLLATGRTANVEGMGLNKAGIKFSKNGILVDNKCRTNQKHVYACGDVTGDYQLAHMSEHMAKVAVTNALVKVPMKIDKKHVPWVTYTDPELGHVGAKAKELDEQGVSYETYRFPYSKIDRAVTESAGEGLIKIYAKKWNGKILGADVLGAHAGELISEYALAMRNGVTLRQMADTIHPYPSYGLGARRAADQWYIKNQKKWQTRLIKKVFGYKGEIPDLSDPDRIV